MSKEAALINQRGFFLRTNQIVPVSELRISFAGLYIVKTNAREFSYLIGQQRAGFLRMRLLYEEVSTRDLLYCLLGRRDCRFSSANGLRHDFLGIQHECQCEDVEEENDDDEKEEDDDEAERHV
jgi:hypothetical protein